jgi:hypothetical protein
MKSQGKVVLQFILQVVFGELVIVFGERCKFLTIWILNLKIFFEDLKMGGV